MKIKTIKVNMELSPPSIINDFVIIGSGYFDLNKISYINEIDKYYDNSTGYIKFFEFACDGIIFKPSWNYRGSFDPKDNINNINMEKFQKFHIDFIDAVFTKKTERNLNKSYI